MILLGDCLEVMPTLEADSVDAIVTDPPYGLSFMGKDWDHGVPGAAFWAEALRVAKPGAHLLAFGGTRTYHRLAVAVEDAGWEIRDCIAWIYGSGFPKSLDVSKAIDKAAGAEREVVGTKHVTRILDPETLKKDNYTVGVSAAGGEIPITAPATDAAKRWAGWGTALKPAHEPIIMARKPFRGTVAENVQAHGTGAINVDGCRVGAEAVTINTWDDGAKSFGGGAGHDYTSRTVTGRFPANLIHDGSDEATAVFPTSNGGGRARILKRGRRRGGGLGLNSKRPGEAPLRDAGSGSAARFFYCAKASKADRGAANDHPTVKPSDLMRYLCRLVTPPGGLILDPFCGSGSTGKAARLDGFRFVGIERDPHYAEIARLRVEAAHGPDGDR